MNKEKNRLDTRQLIEYLYSNDNLTEAIEHLDASIKQITLAEYLNVLIGQRKMTIAQLIISTNLSKSFVYQLFNGSRSAGRDAVLRIAFALSLPVEETQKLLTVSGNSILYPRVRQDAAIIFCLNKHLPIAQTNELLLEVSLKPLDIGGE